MLEKLANEQRLRSDLMSPNFAGNALHLLTNEQHLTVKAMYLYSDSL
jgi:hypothetical protein